MASQYEISRGEQIVDVRPWGTRLAESLADPFMLVITAFVIIVLTLALPVLMVATMPLLVALFVVVNNVSTALPLRYPPESVNPENGKKGDGIWYLGNMEFDKNKNKRLSLENAVDKFKEVWLADDDLRKHLLILGSTGSGKSELLKGIFFCSLCWGSGFFVADGKADNKLPLDTFNMARFFGRDDDLLMLNFLLAGRTPMEIRTARTRRTNKMNPFSTADADTIVQMGANLLPKADGDAKTWQEKALGCWRGLVPALCWLRDNEAMEISVTSFVDYLALSKLEELYAKGYTLAQASPAGEWNESFLGIKSYLEVGLPGFKIERCLRKHKLIAAKPAIGGKAEPVDQESGTYDQHGYRATQLNPALNLLDKTYGHIFQEKFSEVDMVDVTLNNRILALLIPSLERSSQEAESLGKLTVACLRVMMGKNLGADIEGNRVQILESKATEARYPYVVALDELGYYFADGIAVMFAQARSLGFAMIAAAQDIEKLTEGSRAAEAGAMLANQVTKIFMRIDDANKTNEMIQKYLGRVNVALKSTYEFRDTIGFKRMPEVKLEEIPIATLQNLQSLGAGRAIINTMGQTFKIASFYIGDFLQKYPTQVFHINRFLQVRGLNNTEIELLSLPCDIFNDKIVKGLTLVSFLSGEAALPDIRALADTASYSKKHDRALGMINAVAQQAQSLPANVVGSQRAIILYRTARHYLLGARDNGSEVVKAGTKDELEPSAGDQKNASNDFNDSTEAFVTPGQAVEAAKQAAAQFAQSLVSEHNQNSGEQINHGSGTGRRPNSDASVHDEDPFNFLNEGRPLERKPSAQVITQSGSLAPSTDLLYRAMGSGSIPVIQVASIVLPPALPVQRMPVPVLPRRLQALVSAIVSSGEPLDFGIQARRALAPKRAFVVEVEKAAENALWIGKALAEATGGLGSKGDTVVGFTEKTKESFVRLESALGSSTATESAAAIEQLVASQTTPAPLSLNSTGADFEDIEKLMNEVEASLNG